MAHRAVLTRNLAAPLFLVLACLAVACGGGEEATAAPPRLSDVKAVVRTPEASPTPWPILGKVLTKMEATCALGLTGPELTVTYGAEIEGEAEITRVRLLVDKQVREDIVHLAERAYLRVTRLNAAPNRMVSVQLLVGTLGQRTRCTVFGVGSAPRVSTRSCTDTIRLGAALRRVTRR